MSNPDLFPVQRVIARLLPRLTARSRMIDANAGHDPASLFTPLPLKEERTLLSYCRALGADEATRRLSQLAEKSRGNPERGA